MRLSRLGSLLACFAVSVASASSATEQRASAPECAARAQDAGSTPVVWHSGPAEDARELDRWCRAVGRPIVHLAQRAPSDAPLSFGELVVVTWNAHLSEGRLSDLVEALRAGELTGGRPVHRFVLLVQEVFRRGAEVPAFSGDMRSARPIRLDDEEDAPDVHDYVRRLGLSTVYVPSMRNGAGVFEDRGNAIFSTEPLADPVAFELPFERQRRVAVGATVLLQWPGGTERLNLLNVHLEPLSSPATLWVFRNPRVRQVAALLEFLRTPRFHAGEDVMGTVVGGDFNTVQGGDDEDGYLNMRAWSEDLYLEDSRRTHRMGRLDYLFFRLSAWLCGTAARGDKKFGSDHHPVIGEFVLVPEGAC